MKMEIRFIGKNNEMRESSRKSSYESTKESECLNGIHLDEKEPSPVGACY